MASSTVNRPGLALLIGGPCFTPIQGIHCNGTMYKKKFHCTFYPCLFFHLWHRVQARNLQLSQRTEKWNHGAHLMWVPFASVLRALALVWNIPQQEKTREMLTSTSSALRKERIVKYLSSFSLYIFFCLVLFLWLVFDHGRSDHHHTGLQRVVAAPPGLPEDALFSLMPLLWRRALEVSAV